MSKKKDDSEKDILIELQSKYDIQADKEITTDVLESIPIIGDFISGAVQLIEACEIQREKHLVNVVYAFLKTLYDGTISSEKCNKILKKINKGGYRAEKIELIMMGILNNMVESEKAELLGRLTKAVCLELISIEDFLSYIEILNMLLYSDLKTVMNEWSKLDDDGILHVPTSVKSYMRFSNYGIGERVTYKKTNDKTDYSQTSFYFYDDFSQRFVNCLLNNPTKEIHTNKSLYQSSFDVQVQHYNVATSEDIKKMTDDIFGDK